MLELSSATKLGLDGIPIGAMFGLELHGAGLAGRGGGDWRDDVSETTVLIVGAPVGKTIISSSENDPSESQLGL